MKLIIKCLKILGLLLLFFVLGSLVYLYFAGPDLPPDSNALIEKVIAEPLPEMVKGDTGFVKSGDLDIWYEHLAPSDSSKGALLLIMGISNDALGWPPDFIHSFVEAGYQVIRYDHRGTGLSDWVEGWDAEQAYSLADMAQDGVFILDQLGIQKAHIVGVSMGGMIAQELAIHHPKRVQSLTSIMSSGNIFDQELPPISSEVAYDLIKVALKYSILGTEKNSVKLHLASRMILRGRANYDLDIEDLSAQVLYNLRKRKGYNHQASAQHQSAVSQSGSRYQELARLDLPTLIVHGQSDPFIPIAHGQKCAAIIPTADSLWLENMGHDLPSEFIPIIAEKMMANFARSLSLE